MIYLLTKQACVIRRSIVQSLPPQLLFLGMMKASANHITIDDTTDKHKITGQNLGKLFNSRRGCGCVCHAIAVITKTA
jgi:hypothetical protein